MQQRAKAKKIRLLFDGDEKQGLSKCTGIKPARGEAQVNENGNRYTIGDDNTNWPPIEFEFTDRDDNRDFFYSWLNNREIKDITFIEQDGTGAEIRRRILPSAEVLTIEENDYDSGTAAAAILKMKVGYYQPIDV